jgi:hypothetical protein
MKLSLECSVEGKVKINKELKVVEGSKEYVLIPDKEGWLSKIKIVRKVVAPDKYSAKILPGNGKAKHKIKIGGDREEYLELIREFQELEGILSFETIGSLKSIEWDAPTENFIAETEEEKELVQVHDVCFKKEYPDYPASLDEEGFGRIIRNKEHYVSLIVPQAFYIGKEQMNLLLGDISTRSIISILYWKICTVKGKQGTRISLKSLRVQRSSGSSWMG